jgi:uncharacterized membrane protein
MPGTLLAVAAKSAAGTDSPIARAADTYVPHIRSNVSDVERVISLGAGAALVGYGLTGRKLNLLSLLAGGYCLYRAATGNCPGYQMLGVSTAGGTGPNTAVRAGAGMKVEATTYVNAPVEQVYRYWRILPQLPQFMSHLDRVEILDDNRSRWTAKAPLGMKVSWEAELIDDRPNRMIAWRSVHGVSDVDTAGSVHFTPTDAGTRVDVALKFDPPGGKLGSWVARVFGEDPDQTVREDLERFRTLVEKGGAAR